MKKIILIALVILSVQAAGFSQRTEDEDGLPKKEKNSGDLFEQMQKMQREMLKMFGGGDTDSSGVFSFKFGSPNMQMDTSFSKSFGGIFDGKEWKSTMPGDSTMGMGDMMRQLQDKMPDLGRNFDMSEMFKGFGKMFGEGMDGMPRIEPKQKQRLGEGDKKEKKYKTESL
jgi:hypothetical protein